MRNDEAGGSRRRRGASLPARVEVHPSAAGAARDLMTAMADEFDRWMADEIEELAESIHVAAGSTASPHVRAYLRQLADQLARQADMLGYPDVARVAGRLSRQFAAEPGEAGKESRSLDERIAELRALMKH